MPRLPDRLLALGGVVGPAAFIGAWSVLGATRDGYSPIHDAISRLAEHGASTAPAMTAGFMTFGIAVPAFAMAIRREVEGPAWLAAFTTGVATIGVAATPLDSGVDALHGLFAGVGYLSLASVPFLAAPALRGRGRPDLAVASQIISALSGVCLVATLAGQAHGFFQRAGLTMGDAWLVAAGVGLAFGRGPLAALRR